MPHDSLLGVPRKAWHLPEEIELRAQSSRLLQPAVQSEPSSFYKSILAPLVSLKSTKVGSYLVRRKARGDSVNKSGAFLPLHKGEGTSNAKWIPREKDISTSRTKRVLRRLHGGWRTGVAWGTLGAFVVLTINVALLLWIKSSHIISDAGLATVFEGDCGKKTQISVWCHLLINACSTLLLSASNNAMQCLSAPTRSNVDRAHESGSWLDIGILSTRNLKLAGWKRVALWVMLGLSSLPLHLFYNSVVSTTLSTTDYKAIIVTKDFLNDGTWNISRFEGNSVTNSPYNVSDNDLIGSLQKISAANNNMIVQDLSAVDCFRAYNHEFVSDRRNVVLIGNDSRPADSVSNIISYSIDAGTTSSPEWLCGANRGSCDRAALLNNITRGIPWTFKTGTNVDFYEDVYSIDTCRTELISPHCKVTFSVHTLLIVIVCNALKALTLCMVLFLPGFTPLITVGDAITSFLSSPDPTTKGSGIAGHATIGNSTSNELYVSKAWKPERCHWFCGASSRQWTVGTLSTLAVIFPALILLLLYRSRPFTDQGGKTPTLSDLWNLGFGADHTSTLVTLTNSQISNALISNLPQLALSAIYLSYNLLLTSMMMVAEYNAFATSRKTLRVSDPKGYQRSAYYLQLPYRYAIPLIIASGLLHWSVSQSFFQVNLSIYSPTGTTDLARNISACGWSPIALVVTLFLVAVLVLVLCILGCRSYNPGMPVMRSNSRDISAACHMPIFKPDAALYPIRYGAMDVQGWDRWRGCFSNEKVVPLIRKSDGGFRLDRAGEEEEDWSDLEMPKGRDGEGNAGGKYEKNHSWN